MNIILSLILLCNILLLAIIVYALLYFTRIYHEFKAFVTAPDDKTPSPMAQVISMTADMLARSLVAQAKSTFMGIQSGSVRAENAVSADIAFDAIGQVNPAIGAILNSFPSLKKTLKRNPALLDLALSKLAGSSMARTAITPTNPEAEQVKFKL